MGKRERQARLIFQGFFIFLLKAVILMFDRDCRLRLLHNCQPSLSE